MKKTNHYVISEYEYLHCKDDSDSSGGFHEIDAKTFATLKQFIYDSPELNEFITITSKKHYGEVIYVQNYVGVLQTKQGVTIEILPKIHKSLKGNEEDTRKIFLNMLKKLQNSPFKNINIANLQQKEFPILEVFISLFLGELAILVKQGLKKSYQKHNDNLFFLRGKLDVVSHMRKNLLHKERFSVTYDEFTENCPENKLIKSCLLYLAKHIRSSSNQKRHREMLFIFDQIAPSANITHDLHLCYFDNRLESHYSTVMKWVALFLDHKSLINFSGKHMSLALLFPMEKIFEDYVAYKIKEKYPEWSIKKQDRKHYLIEQHKDRPIFQLRPDIVMQKDEGKQMQKTIVLDTKRKMIDENNRGKKYGIKESDMYQLFAYAKKYDCPEVYLIYPRSENFKRDLDVFEYHGDSQALRVVGYDLENDSLELNA